MTASGLSRRDVFGLSGGVAVNLLAEGALGRPRQARFEWSLQPPESAGMSRAGLETVRATVQRHIDGQDLLGAVTAIARDNRLVWFEAQGVRDAESGVPLRTDDIFRMASSTKPLTATCVMMLLEAGRLALDDQVRRFIPNFTNPKVIEPPSDWLKAMADPALRPEVVAKFRYVRAEREITIHDLLTHTSGLGSIPGPGPGPGLLIKGMDFDRDKSLADFVASLGAVPLDFQPGTRWVYSPLYGFDTLLRIVEIVSGQPADVFMRERLFEPLEMRDTHFNLPPSKQARLVPLYERKDNAWRPAKSPLGDGPTKHISGAGGLMSTARDYMQFAAMLFNRGELNGRRILKSESVALMATNQVGEMMQTWNPSVTKGRGYGLGVGVTLDPAVADEGRGRGSFGWDGALGTDSWVDPENRLTVAYFVQQPVRAALLDFGRSVRAAIAA